LVLLVGALAVALILALVVRGLLLHLLLPGLHAGLHVRLHSSRLISPSLLASHFCHSSLKLLVWAISLSLRKPSPLVSYILNRASGSTPFFLPGPFPSSVPPPGPLGGPPGVCGSLPSLTASSRAFVRSSQYLRNCSLVSLPSVIPSFLANASSASRPHIASSMG